MIEFKLPKGPCRVGNKELVRELTQAGWRLVAMTTGQEVVTLRKRELSARQIQNRNDNGYTGLIPDEVASQEAVADAVLFVLQQDEESALAESTKAAEAMEWQRSQAVSDLAVERAAHDETKRALETRRQNQEGLERLQKRAEEARLTAEQRLRRMETDLGKLRAAVGELKVKEILGS